MKRQEIFSGDRLRLAWFVIHEAALRAMFGSAEVMRAQIGKLIESEQRREIVIRIIPSTVLDCAGADGPMTIFDMPDQSRAVYVEGSQVGKVIEAPAEVAKLVTVFDLLRAAALPRGESIRLMQKIGSEYSEATPGVA
jgi:hypothetical protein